MLTQTLDIIHFMNKVVNLSSSANSSSAIDANLQSEQFATLCDVWNNAHATERSLIPDGIVFQTSISGQFSNTALVDLTAYVTNDSPMVYEVGNVGVAGVAPISRISDGQMVQYSGQINNGGIPRYWSFRPTIQSVVIYPIPRFNNNVVVSLKQLPPYLSVVNNSGVFSFIPATIAINSNDISYYEYISWYMAKLFSMRNSTKWDVVKDEIMNKLRLQLNQSVSMDATILRPRQAIESFDQYNYNNLGIGMLL